MWFRKSSRGRSERRNFRLLKSSGQKEKLSKLMSGKRHRFFAPVPLHRFWKTAKKILIVLISILITTGAVYGVFFSSTITIKTIQYLENGKEEKTPAFNKRIVSLLNKNMFFSPTSTLEREILNDFPDEIINIDIRKKIPSTIRVVYSTYPPVANAIIRLPDIQKKFILSERGLVIAQDNEDPALPYLTFSAETLPELKSQAISPKLLYAMVNAERIFTDKFGMKVQEIRYLKREREAHLVTDRNFLIMLDLTQDTEIQLFKLKRALPAINIFEDSIEYIDLRISGQNGDKVILKRK